jgi:hypothetical protein
MFGYINLNKYMVFLYAAPDQYDDYLNGGA